MSADPTTERLLAHLEIRNLASRYAVAVDGRDLDALVALFVPDIRVGRDASGTMLVGRAALRDDFDRSLRALGVTILNVGTHRIELVDADHAHGNVYCKAEIQDGDRWIHQAIRYDDTYERRDGEWLFVRRRHLLFYGLAVANPLQQEPADWPLHHDGRGSIPWSDPSWRAFWGDTPPAP
jgi:ketosteroid isomerase-like protein